ncbi:hypothetical protein [Oceanobacillus sp. CAU 1775]
MKNEIVGFLFFVFLITGIILGLLLEQVHFFGVLGLGCGLVVVFLFRKRK